ncbi:receptor-like protein 43 [Rhodamnia argentea]|uniref:Receptor-like protein 43 n=1 Tax=Rhodamnia argentea TaxID=178133 RepID=A0ABM3H2U4_9MYRT|nr:receptor-like protein 43 [Rhodamnia argentea]
MDSSQEFKTVMSLVAALALFTSFVIPLPAHASPAEAQALVKWKSSLGHHSVSSLSSWTPSPRNATGSKLTISPCTWYGISCRAGSVIGINLTNANVEGTLDEFPFSSLSNLMFMDLGINSLFGHIPPQIGLLSNLTYLDLSVNRFSGKIPPKIGRLNKLEVLHLVSNDLNGSIPQEIGQLHLFNELALYCNQLHGSIPSSLGNLSKLAYSFSGHILDEIGNLRAMLDLELSTNQFTGPIPSSLGNLTDLEYLFLRENQLSGSLPPEICNATNLSVLILSDNSLAGSLPECLSNFSIVLDFSNNKIEDKFPAWLGTLPDLKVLILRSYKFKGFLDFPKVAHLFLKLHILDLSNNDFTGPLPPNLIAKLQGMINGQNRQKPQDKSLYMRQEVGRRYYEASVNVIMKGKEIRLERILTIFTTIDLSLNSFQGNIPNVIGNLHSLIGLNLSHNHLMGSIPSSLGNWTNLEWLDLSSNMLSGRIPRELGDLSFLEYLDLSENQLIGRIPQDKQLTTFTSDKFHGNLGLCGTPVQNTCPGDAQPPPPPRSFFQENSTRKHGSGFDRKAVGIGYASGIVIGISIAYISCETERPKWLVGKVRSMERRAKFMRKPRQKAIKFYGGR